MHCAITHHIMLGDLTYAQGHPRRRPKHRILSVMSTDPQLGEYIAMDDNMSLSYEDFKTTVLSAVAIIRKARLDNKIILVHCERGINRSCSAIAAYLMMYHNLSAEEAVKKIKDAKSGLTQWHTMLNPSFRFHLSRMEDEIRKRVIR